MVEKANHIAAQHWWRTLPDEVTVEQAQASLDHWCALRGDSRLRPTGDGKASVLTLAAGEPLAALPVPCPATVSVTRTASAQALVSFRGNQYSVPPELARAQVSVSHWLVTTVLEIATASGLATGTIVARHTLAHPGTGTYPRSRACGRARTRRHGRVRHRRPSPQQTATEWGISASNSGQAH